jgi:hypothetical protein
MKVSHRSTHYAFWFLLFGVIPLILALRHGLGANAPTYEVSWLLGAGLLGLLAGSKNLNDGNFAQPYDLLAGLIFTAAGIVGLVGDFGIQTGVISTTIAHVGLSLGGLYPLLYTFLGLTSLRHGLGKG